jgi:uncharacterized protein (TIGR02246 family)
MVARTLLFLAVLAAAVPASSSAASPQIDPALELTLKRFTEAFNRFDPAEVAAFWAEDGTVITPFGTWGEGRAGVAKAYGEDAATILKGTTSTFTITALRKVAPDLAFLDVDHEVQNARRPDGTTGTMRLHLALLTRREGAAWRWLDARPPAFL